MMMIVVFSNIKVSLAGGREVAYSFCEHLPVQEGFAHLRCSDILDFLD